MALIWNNIFIINKLDKSIRVKANPIQNTDDIQSRRHQFCIKVLKNRLSWLDQHIEDEGKQVF